MAVQGQSVWTLDAPPPPLGQRRQTPPPEKAGVSGGIPDRKRVGWGRRVNLGGGGIIEKKKMSDGPKKLILDVTGPGEIKAKDIQPNPEVTILNPDMVICHLDENTKFHMELIANTGKGYCPSEKNKMDDAPLGLIAIDSLFSPVKKVSYTVENAREGKSLDYDKLAMVVETDGSVPAEDAVAYAARIFQEQMSLFINYEEPKVVEKKDRKSVV